MATLKGKIVVFDFWATWCVPCRAQHPLYEQVKKRFAGNPDVVFLSIDTDEDRALVQPFLDEVKWKDAVYFEDGLSRAAEDHVDSDDDRDRPPRADLHPNERVHAGALRRAAYGQDRGSAGKLTLMETPTDGR